MDLADIKPSLIGQTIGGRKVIKVTDGTLDTTFSQHVYRYRQKGGTYQTDGYGKLIVEISKTYLDDVPGAELIETVPDVKDKRVWWQDTKTGKHFVGTYDEFLAAVTEKEQVISVKLTTSEPELVDAEQKRGPGRPRKPEA